MKEGSSFQCALEKNNIKAFSYLLAVFLLRKQGSPAAGICVRRRRLAGHFANSYCYGFTETAIRGYSLACRALDREAIQRRNP
jgi:hypothetical protein